MQKMLKNSILLSLLIAVCNPIESKGISHIFDNLDDVGKAVVGASTAFVGIGVFYIGYYFRGSNYQAEALQQQRLLEVEKNKLEEEKNRKDAQRALFEIKKRYEPEFDFIKKHGDLTKEMGEQSALQHADQTPFYHIRYAKLLREDLEKLYSLNPNFSDIERKKAEKMANLIKVIRESNNKHFKDSMAIELNEKDKAIAQQEMLDYQIAAKKEKYLAKEIKTNALRDARKAINDTARHAEKTLNDIDNRSLASNALLAAEHAALLKAFYVACDQNGWFLVSERLKKVENKLISKDEIQSLLSMFARERKIKNSGRTDNETKKQLESIRALIIQRLNKIDEKQDLTIELVSANLDTPQQYTQNQHAPSAPPRDY